MSENVLTENENLYKLKSLTEALQFKQISCGEIESVVELDVPTGSMFLFGLFKNENVAISRCYMTAGTTVKHHLHNEWELIVVVSGGFMMESEKQGEIDLSKPKSIVYFEPGDKHWVTDTLENTWCLCVTMPSSSIYPSGICV